MTSTKQLFDLESTPEKATFSTGILPSQTIKQYIESGKIISDVPIESGQLQPSSIDLRLGPVAYRVLAGFLPGKHSSVMGKLKQLGHNVIAIDLTSPYIFEKDCVYIVPLLEELRLPSQISAKANPKSTTGRLDIFTRLITDYGSLFDRVPAGYKGKLYAEISPRSFSIRVGEGMSLNQLRFARGAPPPSDKKLLELHEKKPLVYGENDELLQPVIENGLTLSIDLEMNDGPDLVGYIAKNTTAVIDLAQINHYEPFEFWDPIMKPPSGEVIIEPNKFYILASKEKIRIPPSYAAEMVPYDPVIGEFRAHYAGFFDPGFGCGDDDKKGTRAVLEIKAHYVPFLIRHRQIVARLAYERMMHVPEDVYGADIGSSYHDQTVTLSKHFKQG